ncbi:MAG: hypothetical protein ACLQE9_12410, partial [Roseiarcus sp.]
AAWGVSALALPLSGCVELAADMAPKTEAHAAFALRTDVSLAGASVAFVSVEGPPAAISTNFSQIMTREAMARDIVIADEKKARYLVRGYLSSYVTTDGAAVEYVWDVFNKDKQRIQRVNDVLEVKGEGADLWLIVGDDALTSVAAKSADDLAAYLSNTPEAVAAAPAPAPPIAVSESKPLSYAPVN